MTPFKYCPDCGDALPARGSPQICPSCGAEHYQHSHPCAGAVVERDGKVLLVRRAVEPFRDHWDLPGGFLEAGEHPSDGAIREVAEETGLEVELLQELGTYIDTYGTEGNHTLNHYYLAKIAGGTLGPADDAAELAWFGPRELPEPIAFPHLREVLEKWAGGRDV